MRKTASFFILFAFFMQCVMPSRLLAQAVVDLPAPGTMVALSPVFKPAQLQGMVIDPKEPFKFDFLISRGDELLAPEKKKSLYQDLVKYFLASLAVPEEDQWVNLSPYENKRIIEENFGMTSMGRDLLAQDYILKQISASLLYPDDQLGKEFWKNVYAKAQDAFGTTDVPVNTFNKVWIIPDEAVILEKGHTALILKSHLKVMLEQDYVAMKHDMSNPALGTDRISENDVNQASQISSDVVRQVILPAIEREVNEGKNFANLRQVVSGMILAAWFKKALKQSVLGQVYADQRKVKGVDQDPANNQAVYEQYVQAFKKGAFNMIREDVDLYSQEMIPRKYFSGGFQTKFENAMKVVDFDHAQKSDVDAAMATLDKAAVAFNKAEALVTHTSAVLPSVDAAQLGSMNKAQVLRRYFNTVGRDVGVYRSGETYASLLEDGLKSSADKDVEAKRIEGLLNYAFDENLWSIFQKKSLVYGISPDDLLKTSGVSSGVRRMVGASADLIGNKMQNDKDLELLLVMMAERAWREQQEAYSNILNGEAKAPQVTVESKLSADVQAYGSLIEQERGDELINVLDANGLKLESFNKTEFDSNPLKAVYGVGAVGKPVSVNDLKRSLFRIVPKDAQDVRNKYVRSVVVLELPGYSAGTGKFDADQAKSDNAERSVMPASIDQQLTHRMDQNQGGINSYLVEQDGLGMIVEINTTLMNDALEAQIWAAGRVGTLKRMAQDKHTKYSLVKAKVEGLPTWGVAAQIDAVINRDENGDLNLNNGSGKYSDVYAKNIDGQESAVKVNKQIQGATEALAWAEDEVAMLKGLESFGGPQKARVIHVVVRQKNKPPLSTWAVAMKRINGVDILSLKNGYVPDFLVTEKHLQSAEHLFERLNDAGLSLVDPNLSNVMLEYNGVVRLIDTRLEKRKVSPFQNTQTLAGIISVLKSRIGVVVKPAVNVNGGIDLNTANLNMQIKRDGNGVPLPVAQQNLGNIKIDGLVPVILDIKPVSMLPELQ